MKKSIFAAVLSALVSLSLAAQTVAVFDFDCDDPDFKEDVSVMTDLLVHELVKAGDVTVVERKKMDKIMAEYAFQANPYVDISGAKKLGKGVGADCIIVGSIASLGCPLYVTARMIDVEKGTIIHSAKMTLNFWSDYEQKLPVFAAECVKKMPVPNLFTGVWSGSISTDEFDDNYEIRFGEKSKCAVKVTSVDAAGCETVQEGIGTYSYSGDALSGGKMFRLNVAFKGAKIPRLRKIEWAYPVSMNAQKNEFSLNVRPSAKSDTLVRLTLNKEE
ncbi:MAG: CsgG/HfaB family protein [Treponema sp.]